jgi:hypothetical protein
MADHSPETPPMTLEVLHDGINALGAPAVKVLFTVEHQPYDRVIGSGTADLLGREQTSLSVLAIKQGQERDEHDEPLGPRLLVDVNRYLSTGQQLVVLEGLARVAFELANQQES